MPERRTYERTKVQPGSRFVCILTVLICLVGSTCTLRPNRSVADDLTFREFPDDEIPSPVELIRTLVRLKAEFPNVVGGQTRQDQQLKSAISNLSPQAKQQLRRFAEYMASGQEMPNAVDKLENVLEHNRSTTPRENARLSSEREIRQSRPPATAVNPDEEKRSLLAKIKEHSPVNIEKTKELFAKIREQFHQTRQSPVDDHGDRGSANSRKNEEHNSLHPFRINPPSQSRTITIPPSGHFDVPTQESRSQTRKFAESLLKHLRSTSVTSGHRTPPDHAIRPLGSIGAEKRLADKISALQPAQRSSSASQEKFRDRFNRILMNAAQKSVSDESMTNSSSKSVFDSMVVQLIESADKSLKSRNSNWRGELREVWNGTKRRVKRSSRRTAVLFRGGSVSDMGMVRESAGSSPVLGIIGLVMFAVVCFAWRGRLAGFFGRYSNAFSAPTRFYHQEVESPSDLVSEFDRVMSWNFGSQTDWWTSRVAKRKLARRNPHLDSQISELVDNYEIARYAPKARRIHDSTLKRCSETICRIAESASNNDATT